MGLREGCVKLHRLAAVRDGAIKELQRRLVLGARRFVRGELRSGEARPAEGIPWIDRDGALEVGDRARQFPHVERLDPQPSFHDGAVGLEARRLAVAGRGRSARRDDAQLAGELRCYLVLEIEDVVEASVDLCVRDRFTAEDIHDPGGDADAVGVALKAADDHEPHAERGRDVVECATRPPRRFGHAPAVDDAEPPERAEIAADGFRDTGGQPRGFGVAGHVGEVEHGDRMFVDPRGLIDRGLQGRGYRVNRRDEAVAAARDGLDESWISRLVAERLAELRHGLRERVVRDVRIRPQGFEQRFLRDQAAGGVEEVQQEVEELRRDLEGTAVAEHAVCGPVDDERAEAISSGSQRRHCNYMARSRVRRAPGAARGSRG